MGEFEPSLARSKTTDSAQSAKAIDGAFDPLSALLLLAKYFGAQSLLDHPGFQQHQLRIGVEDPMQRMMVFFDDKPLLCGILAVTEVAGLHPGIGEAGGLFH